jgi:hypothetical protein
LTDDIEATFGGYFGAVLRDECHLIGQDAAGNFSHGRSDGRLKVELDLDCLFQQVEVAVLDMPPIFPQMNRDGIGTPKFGLGCSPDRIGFNGTTGLPDCGDMINVDPEGGHAKTP